MTLRLLMVEEEIVVVARVTVPVATKLEVERLEVEALLRVV